MRWLPPFVLGAVVGGMLVGIAAVAVSINRRPEIRPGQDANDNQTGAAQTPAQPTQPTSPLAAGSAAQPPAQAQGANQPASPPSSPAYSAKDQAAIKAAREFINGYRSKPLTAKAVGVEYEVGGDDARVAFDDMNEYEAYLRYDALRKRWNVRYFTFTVGNQVIRYPP